MSEKKSIFAGAVEDFDHVNIEAPLAEAQAPYCSFYHTPYYRAAKTAKERGDEPAHRTYSFLAILSAFELRADTPADPYVPMFQIQGQRSPVPADLSESDMLVVEALANRAQDPALRARLSDILWEIKKDHKACGEAATQYILAGEKLSDLNWGHYPETCYRRGLYLALRLGRQKDTYQNAVQSLQKNVRKNCSCELMHLLLEHHSDNYSEFGILAREFAQEADAKGELLKARMYWEVAADFFKADKVDSAEKSARLAAAETYVAEGEQKVGESAMIADHFLRLGIEALRQAGEKPERIRQLRERLIEYQKGIQAEMHTISTEYDVSEVVQSAREHVKSDVLLDSLFRFSLGHTLSNSDKLKEEVEEQMEKTPLLYIMGASHMDERGRVIASTGGVNLFDDEESQQEAFEARMFSHARFHWAVRAQAYIDPARVQILNDHNPNFQDIYQIVHHNPFVPPGHENIFARGLHAGFHGDFLIISHLLVPQIENSLRYVLEARGVDVSNLQSDGTQPVKTLGALLVMPELEAILGSALCFELRGHLIEKTGYDFRNRVSHGFVNNAECNSEAALSIWWLVLRLCLAPIYNMIQGKKEDEGGENDPEPSGYTPEMSKPQEGALENLEMHS